MLHGSGDWLPKSLVNRERVLHRIALHEWDYLARLHFDCACLSSFVKRQRKEISESANLRWIYLWPFADIFGGAATRWCAFLWWSTVKRIARKRLSYYTFGYSCRVRLSACWFSSSAGTVIKKCSEASRVLLDLSHG